MGKDYISAVDNKRGAYAVDKAIAAGMNLDGSPISPKKLELYNKMMATESARKRSGELNLRTAQHILKMAEDGAGATHAVLSHEGPIHPLNFLSSISFASEFPTPCPSSI